MTQEEIERKKAELLEDIQFVDKNLSAISSGIIQNINLVESLKNGGINLYHLDGVKIDRRNNKAEIFDLETFERQLAHESAELYDKISEKTALVKFLTREHSRIQGVKRELLEKYQAISLTKPTSPLEESQKPVQKEEPQQLTFDDITNTKK